MSTVETTAATAAAGDTAARAAHPGPDRPQSLGVQPARAQATAVPEAVLSIPSVTGVDLRLQVAGPGGRSFAFLVDWHIRLLVAVAWFFVGSQVLLSGAPLPQLAGGVDPIFAYLVLLPVAAIYFLYHPVLEVLMKGRTPGKRIAGVRLVKRDGGTPGIGPLLIRNVFRLVDSMPFGYSVGLISVMLTRQSVRIGDLAAGTLLVYDAPRPLDMLAGLSGGAVERIGLQHAEIVRDLLDRWSELEPDARSRLARKLLAKVDDVPAEASEQELHRRLEALLA